jgi:hypothetical protein
MLNQWINPVTETCAGTLVGGLVGFGLGVFFERRSELKKDKFQLVPKINLIIKNANRAEPLPVWRREKENLEILILRFRMQLTGKSKQAFDQAWERCKNIKDEDLFPYNTPNFVSKGKTEDRKQAQKFLTDALSGLLESIEKA